MPKELLTERLRTPRHDRAPYRRNATWFQDIVIRCVKFAFAKIPAKVGAVFFSKYVALPFMRWRMLRHGYLKSPIHWEEVENEGMQGLWLIHNPSEPPDVVVLYCHGGGFSMGSSYFYLEFLLAWLYLLRTTPRAHTKRPSSKMPPFQNPAILALEYSLVPTATYPTQLRQTHAAYDFVLSKLPKSFRSGTPDPSRICVAGDSAGGTLVLSLLLSLAGDSRDFTNGEVAPRSTRSRKPGFATLVSPWCTLISARNRDTPSDYLNADSLHLYGSQYLGKCLASDPMASPGREKRLDVWRRASPKYGFHFVWGREEVFAPETRGLVEVLKKSVEGTDYVMRDSDVEYVEEMEMATQIHAWPVVDLFLGEKREERLRGLRRMVEVMGRRMIV